MGADAHDRLPRVGAGWDSVLSACSAGAVGKEWMVTVMTSSFEASECILAVSATVVGGVEFGTEDARLDEASGSMGNSEKLRAGDSDIAAVDATRQAKKQASRTYEKEPSTVKGGRVGGELRIVCVGKKG